MKQPSLSSPRCPGVPPSGRSFNLRVGLFALALLVCLITPVSVYAAAASPEPAATVPDATPASVPAPEAVPQTPPQTTTDAAGVIPGKQTQAASATVEQPATGRQTAGLDPSWQALIARLANDGFDQAEMETIFSRLGPESYSPAFMAAKITELYGIPGIGINRDTATAPAPPEGYTPPVTDTTVGSCLDFIKEHKATFDAIEKTHGVPAPTILAVLLIETGLGQDLGKDPALRALAGMAATSSPDMLESLGNNRQKARVRASSLASTLKTKSEWAYAELKALLRYAEQRSCDPSIIPGSIYGAVGLCQFMPSNVELFGVDGDNDGVIDLFCLPDAMYSIASYLEANGWRGATTDAQRNRVIRTYNNDAVYASVVLGTSKRLENAIKGKGKISLKSNALVGGYTRNPAARLDPSLRRIRHIPKSARVQPLGDYQQLLQ